MTVQQRLLDYRRQYEDQMALLQTCRDLHAKLEAELKECERLGEIPSEDLMRDLRDTETWLDYNLQQCDELKIEIEECEAYLAEDE